MHKKELRSVAFRPDEPRLRERRSDLATGDRAGTVVIWDIGFETNGKGIISEVSGRCRFSGSASALSFQPDGHLLLVGIDSSEQPSEGEYEGQLALIDLEGTECLESSEWECDPGPCVMWTTGPGGANISLPPIHGVAFSKDGSRFAAVGDSGLVRWWQFNHAGKSVDDPEGVELGGARGRVNAVKFFPRTETLAAAGQDGVVRIWDLASREEANPLELSQAATGLYSLAISQDDQLIAAGGARGRVHLWDLDSSRYVCDLVLRNLTWKEWSRAVGHCKGYLRVCRERDFPRDLPEDVDKQESDADPETIKKLLKTCR